STVATHSVTGDIKIIRRGVPPQFDLIGSRSSRPKADWHTRGLMIETVIQIQNLICGQCSVVNPRVPNSSVHPATVRVQIVTKLGRSVMSPSRDCDVMSDCPAYPELSR